mmetsp:Transcript_28807/g.27732  ORF Transcript_28807/g.27732 Transcript_28807/m.27732 type:complete len:322 (-) Transcript_28807:657-1622(-)|eukprot:CAMPEP_0197825616 /NCGR_PEP_ID=MMETSP1437-20131217/2667_1 /TAXON_ID=49252 ORGANISM="Eucampia antarctica, Strain CCMP1452" /NCGR_SAMPLE_ID=MMETSP1437 /ASSEMBLY_ACC=CAM_ASM_001096 /LENGTH=321 /DNA_ID=CAMNT_0043425691 /DNA_START=106 /DNA_END=1071 /DNA_ORIENTATION=+
MNLTLFATALSMLVSGATAFSPQTRPSIVAANAGKLFMADDKKPSLETNSGYEKKSIAFDEKSGRFFESGNDKNDCIPEDEYCVVDKSTGEFIRLTVAEKERIFLDSLQSYYFSGRTMMNDAEFDLLKEDLSWNGSPVVSLNRKESKYLAAVQAYMKGTPMLEDAEFDQLKTELKEEKSPIAVETEPKCYIDSGVCKVTLKDDSFRNNLLYLPAGIVLSVLWLGFGFEVVGAIIKLNPLILLILGAYPIFKGATLITDDFIFPNNRVVFGPCPSCEAENRVYFGDVFSVEGFGDLAKVKCPGCKVQFSVQRETLRASTLPK